MLDSTNGSATMGETPHHKQNSYVLIFLFGGLACGLAIQAVMNTRWLKRHIGIPHTVLLLLMGFLSGLIIQFSAGSRVDADDMFASFTMANTNPHLIMQVFLPVLIFESAFKLEAHAVFKAFWQILLMAVVGLLITAVLIATCMYLVVNMGQGVSVWTFPICMVFGSILSATDPVAVVSLLREMGAPKQVVVLTEGEALFNDGAAIIAYDIFLKISIYSLQPYAQGQSISMEIARLLAGIVISPVIGLLGGKICEILLKNTFNNEIREKGIILICVYGTFFVCEEVKVSGVLAIVVLGVWLSYQKHSISPEAMEDNDRFWDFFAYWANTLVFLLAGMVISRSIYSNSSDIAQRIDYLYAFVVYIVINAARGFSVAILFPLLKRMGNGLSWKQGLILTWGGLRGAIALLLALQLLDEPPLIPYRKEIGEKVLLYVSGSVALTLLVNATSFSTLLTSLRLNKLPESKLKVIKSSLNYLRNSHDELIKQLKEDRFLAEADWDLVLHYTTLKAPSEINTGREQKRRNAPVNTDTGDNKPSLQEETRMRLIQVEKVSYWRQFSKGLLSHKAIHLLEDSLETVRNEPGKLLDITLLRKEFGLNNVFFKLHSLFSQLVNYHNRCNIEASIRQPRQKYRAIAHNIVSHLAMQLFLYFLVVVHSVLIILDWTDVSLTFPNFPEFAKALKIFLICIFTTETCVKLVSQGLPVYFHRHWNKFDFGLTLVYSINLLNFLNPDQSTAAKTAMIVFEAILLLRLLKIFYFAPMVLPVLVALLEYKLHTEIGLAYDAVKGFIVGQEDISKMIYRLISDENLANDMIAESKLKRLAAVKYLAQLQLRQPGATISVKTKHAARYCLNIQHDHICEMRDSGVIDDSEFHLLYQLLTDQMIEIRRAPPCIEAPSFDKRLEHFSWTSGNEELIKFVLEHGEMQQYLAYQRVYSEGDPADGLYIVASGMLRSHKESDGNEKEIFREYLYPGRYFGEFCVISRENRSHTVTAEVDSVVCFIPLAKVKLAVEYFNEVFAQFLQSYCVRKCIDVLHADRTFSHWSDIKLKTHFFTGKHVDLTKLGKYKRRAFNEVIVLIRGGVKDLKTGQTYRTFNYTPVVLPKYCYSVVPLPDEPENVWLYSIPAVSNKPAAQTTSDLVLAQSISGISLSNSVNFTEELKQSLSRQPSSVFPAGMESFMMSTPTTPVRRTSAPQGLQTLEIPAPKIFYISPGETRKEYGAFRQDQQNEFDQIDSRLSSRAAMTPVVNVSVEIPQTPMPHRSNGRFTPNSSTDV